MGFSFSIAFCPTMFVLYFVTLMPVALTSSYGFLLPSVFGIGTSLPVLAAIWMITFIGLSGSLLKRSRRTGQIVQRAAGIVLVIMGMLDTITYWI